LKAHRLAPTDIAQLQRRTAAAALHARGCIHPPSGELRRWPSQLHRESRG